MNGLRGRMKVQAEWRNEGLTGNYLFELEAGYPSLRVRVGRRGAQLPLFVSTPGRVFFSMIGELVVPVNSAPEWTREIYERTRRF